MGFSEFADKAAKFSNNHKYDTSFEGVRVSGNKLQKGTKSWLVAGTRAELEHGANIGSRVTATRIVLTGVFALALKKNKNKVYVIIETQSGEQILIEGKVKDETKARAFVAKVNQASAHFGK